jgi:DNA-binding transcriptional LysR family regulator
VLVAAPAYLQQHGTPKTPEALAGHEALIYSSVQGDARWHFTQANQRHTTVAVKGRLRSNNLSALLAAARGGMGVAALPLYVAHESLQSGAVQALLPKWSLPSQEVHAVFPSPRLVTAKVSGLVGWLQQQLSGNWWEGQPPAPP